MRLDFAVNYRLDSPRNSNIRIAKILIPTAGVRGYKDKDKYLLGFCGEIASICQDCCFYKNAQVMAPFLERPVRIKYMIALPNDVAILLDASLKQSELRRKAKELQNYFEIVIEQNKTNLAIKHSLLLTARTGSDTAELEKEYGIKIMSLKEAINLFKEEM